MGQPARIFTSADDADRSKAKGGSGTSINLGSITSQDINTDVRGRLWYGDNSLWGIANEMMADPHVKRSVEAIVDPLLAATWDFAPASKDPLDIEAADYARWDFFECNDWENTLRLAANGLVRDGFALFEWTDTSDRTIPTKRFPLHPGGGLGVGYTKAHHRPANTLEEWHQSPKDPEIADGISQWLQGSDAEESGDRTIRLSKGDLFWHLVWDQEGANFEGRAPLRAAYGAFKVKRLLLILAMLRHQREGVGIPKISEPSPEDLQGQAITEDEVLKAKEILRSLNAHENSYIYLPSGYSFEWQTTTGQSTGLHEAIEQCNRDIAYNLGIAWMLLGSSGKTGSWALATEQRGHYVLSLEKYARFIERAVNIGRGWSPVERLIRRNYGSEVGLPRLVARNMPTRDWSRLLPMLPALVKSKLLQSDDVLRGFLRTVTFLPEEDPETAQEFVEEAKGALQSGEDEEQGELDEETQAAVAAWFEGGNF